MLDGAADTLDIPNVLHEDKVTYFGGLPRLGSGYFVTVCKLETGEKKVLDRAAPKGPPRLSGLCREGKASGGAPAAIASPFSRAHLPAPVFGGGVQAGFQTSDGRTPPWIAQLQKTEVSFVSLPFWKGPRRRARGAGPGARAGPARTGRAPRAGEGPEESAGPRSRPALAPRPAGPARGSPAPSAPSCTR